VPLATMMEEGQEGWGGRREERSFASGVVWKVAPESAIQSGLAVVLKEYARLAAPDPPAPAAAVPAAMVVAAPGRWAGGSGGGD
jgi:hypothetical protein